MLFASNREAESGSWRYALGMFSPLVSIIGKWTMESLRRRVMKAKGRGHIESVSPTKRTEERAGSAPPSGTRHRGVAEISTTHRKFFGPAISLFVVFSHCHFLARANNIVLDMTIQWTMDL